MCDITDLKDCVAPLFNVFGSICGIAALFLTLNRDENVKNNQHNSCLDKISDKFEDFLSNAAEYWSNSELSKGTKDSVGHKMTFQLKSISLMVKRLKEHNISNLLEELNEVNKTSTGGNFQSNPKIDNNKVILINSQADAVKKTISSMYR